MPDEITVHPHGCGDNGGQDVLIVAVGGSPPRVWGQRLCHLLDGVAVRFTPTGVGTTQSPPAKSACSPVHPHGCGDNVCAPQGGDCCRGSPPRVWGQRRNLRLNHRARRFTPTGVGTTADFSARQIGMAGSPPRVWGQRSQPGCRPGPRRFTPTGVGTTISSWASLVWTSVHPHGCGDNCIPGRKLDGVIGSPPRVWGQRHWRARFSAATTVHPHGCGDNENFERCYRGAAVHPHGCGDNEYDNWPQLFRVRFTPTGVGTTACHPPSWNWRSGSPPRVWGQRFVLVVTAVLAAVHPHGCGDNQVAWARIQGHTRFTPTGVGTTPRSLLPNSAACGSPPRVWGQRM